MKNSPSAVRSLAVLMKVPAIVSVLFTLSFAAEPLAAAGEGAVITAPLQCKKASYGFCCEFGVPCDCSKGVTSPGQCAQASYDFCCSIGTVCDCSQPPLNDTAAIALTPAGLGLPGGDAENGKEIPETLEVVDFLPNVGALLQPLQCEKVSYGFCCELGVPCDCSKGVTAPGQCQQSSYAFCCSIGKVCDCTVPPLVETRVAAVSLPVALAKPLQCRKASYGFCCEVGVPCDCSKGVTAPGQCTQTSYSFCCSIGAVCDCSQPPLSDALLGLPYAEPTTDGTQKAPSGNDIAAVLIPEPPKVQVVHPLQCKKASYAFCCEIGVPCDCTKGVTAAGQCKAASYVFCCSVGAKCDCTQPPFDSVAGILV